MRVSIGSDDGVKVPGFQGQCQCQRCAHAMCAQGPGRSSKRGGGRGGRRASLPRAPAPSSPKLAGPGAEQPPQKNGTGRITALASRDNANECHCQLNRSHLHLASPFTHHKRSRKSHPQGAAPAAEARRAALRVHRHRQVGEHALVAATSTTAA